MKRIFALAVLCSILSFTNVSGQDEGYFAVHYDMSFGTGDLGEYISPGSFRGASAQYRFAATQNIMVGVDLGWNVFYERKDYDSYTVDTRTLSGIQYRYQNEVPILVSIDYILTTDKDFKPYIGFGLGTMYTERATDMGQWRLDQKQWHFAVKPEAGLMYKVSYGTALKLAVKYNSGIKAGDLESQGYVTVAIGLAFNY